jgi:SAM-dependent methyltransferase
VVLGHRRRALLGRHPGRVLDVGCGDGDFLADLRRLGWEGYGTEFSEVACELTRARGINVRQGSLRSAGFPDRFFDVVTIWHVLEHLPEPAAELAEARRILRDDGLLVLEVPNSGCLTFQLCQERWWPLDIPRHLQHFTPATLARLLDRSGFTSLRRQNFHYADVALATISFINRLGLIGRLEGDHYFVTDYRRATLAAKARFLLLGPVIGLLSLPYSVIITLLTRNSETVTVTASKTAP